MKEKIKRAEETRKILDSISILKHMVQNRDRT